MAAPDAADGGGNFPRGLVLGLTMAEIAILIIFVLLLALAALLAREEEKRRNAETERDRLEAIAILIEEEGLPEDAVELRAVLRERVDEHEHANRWRELHREIESTFPEASVQDVVTAIQESEIGRMAPEEAERLLEAHRAIETDDAHAELEQALEDAGVEATPSELGAMANLIEDAARYGMAPEEVESALENWNEQAPAIEMAERIEELLGGQADRRAMKRIFDDAERWREQADEETLDAAERLAREQDRNRILTARVESLEVRLGGGGTDHPSCWYDSDNTVAYLFDVALYDDGLVVDLASAPEHEEKRDRLPLADVRTRRLLTEAQFLNQTRPVLEWSVEHDPECRFFVRAFDLTAGDQKALYKRRMRAVESRFYKLLTTAQLPDGLRRDGE